MSDRRQLKLIISLLWLILVALIISLLFSVRWYNSNLQPVNNQQTAKQRFEIARGATLDEVALNLQSQGLIKDAAVFKWHSRFNGLDGNLQAGVFELSPSDYASEIAEVINSAALANLAVTIYPGQRLDQVEDSLVEQGFDRLDVQVAMQLSNYGSHRVQEFLGGATDLEGYLAPETFYVNQFNAHSAEGIVNRSLEISVDNLEEVRKDLEKEGSHFKNNLRGAIILASIVEAEVDPEDRAKVAQVFIKRLELGMKIESDVTFFYAAAVEGGEPTVDHPSLYNTRLHQGLPPGPIGNFSQSALQAVANPAPTDYLYFVAGDDGNTYFNTTYEDHLADVRRYCIEKCR